MAELAQISFLGQNLGMSPRDAVMGIVGRLLLVGGVALLVVVGLYELALIAAAILIIVFVPDTVTGILTAAGLFFAGQLIGSLVIWIGVTIVRILWWILFGEGSSVSGTLERELSLEDVEALKALSPQERLDWENRTGRFADPRVRPSDVLRRKSAARPDASQRDIEALTPEERLQWANREGDFADQAPTKH